MKKTVIVLTLAALNIFSQNALSATDTVLKPSNILNELKSTIFNETAHYSVRWDAVLRLAEIKSPNVQSELISLTNRKEWFVRNAALVGLEKVNPLKAFEISKKLIHDQALVVRSASLEVFRNYYTKKDRSVLWTELHQKYNFRGEQSLWIRKDIVEVLAEKPVTEDYAQFIKLLNDNDENIQFKAAQALDLISGKKVAEPNSSRKNFINAWKKQAFIEARTIK